MSAHRRPFSTRWLAAGGAAVLASIIGVALLLQSSGSACAAPPSTSTKTGKATFYDLGGTSGNCSFETPADDLYVALGPDQYSGGASCGAYLDVTGPKGTVRVKVFDSCPECDTGHLDLSRTAFKKIGAEVDGIIPITYRTVANPATPGALSVTIKDGSSQYWLAVLIDNHGNQLKSVTVNGKSTHREDYNYWIIDGGAGSGPFKIKVTDVSGRSATMSGIKLSPSATQKTTVRLTGAAVQVTKTSPPVKKPVKKPVPKATSKPTVAPLITAAAEAPAATYAEIATPPVDLAAGPAACG